MIDTRTVLFTDLVSSTELRVRLGEDGAEDLRHAHDELVIGAVGEHGGTVVKGLGDGFLATFTAAADGVAAAVAIQRAVARHGRGNPGAAFEVRIGISAGDVTIEDGDVFGTPVVEASRLCGAAGTGQVFVADLVRALARGRGDARFEPIGELDLKGLPEPVAACQAYWDTQDEPVGATPFPPLLAASGNIAYVGRDELRESARAAWRSAAAGQARTVLIGGEPGIGKTRFAAEAAWDAHREGAVVLFGRCDEDLAPPYQPFAEALDWWVASCPPDQLRASLGELPGELARLVPDLAIRVPGIGEPTHSADPVTEQWRLHESLISWITTVAASTGLVLVLDDLHWAGAPTVAALVKVVRAAHAAAGSRLLILGTYRDTDLDRSTPLTASLADLRRLDGVSRFAFGGLTLEELEVFAATAAGHDLDDALRRLAHDIHAETDGNPFFVGEVLRHLVETGGIRRDGERWVVDHTSVSVPDGVREVVGRRLDRLTPEANQILQTAAVLGRDITLDVLVAVVSQTDEQVLDALDAAERARVVEELGADRWRFAHALVRTTIYDELSATRRRRLHRQIVDAIDKLHPDDASALAYHALSAGPDGGDASRAIGWAVEAGRRSLAALAWDDAEQFFVQAVEVAEEADHDPLDRVDALIGIARARVGAGRPVREHLLAAARAALAAGDAARAARAITVEPPSFSSTLAEPDEERIAIIDRILDALPAGTAERAVAQLALGVEVYFTDRLEEGRVGVLEALAFARQHGDPELLVMATAARLNSRPWYLWDDDAAALFAAAPWHIDTYWRMSELTAAISSRMVSGQLTEPRELTEELERRLSADPLPTWQYWLSFLKAGFAAEEGRLDDAKRFNDLGLAQAQEVGRIDNAWWWQAFQARFAIDEGTMGALADIALDLVANNPRGGGFPRALPLVLAESGRLDEAREHLERYASDASDLDDRFFWIGDRCILALAAARVGDLARTAAYLRALETAPAAGFMSYGTITWHPLDYVRGVCHHALGHLDEALDHFGGAAGFSATHGFPLHEIRAQLGIAAAANDRGASGDADRAATALRRARELADAKGTEYLRGLVTDAGG